MSSSPLPQDDGPRPSDKPPRPDRAAPVAEVGEAPAWASGAGRLRALGQGLSHLASVPGLVLFATSLGFGALARDLGLDLGFTVALAAVLYALPAQVIFIDQLARDAALWTAALAVTLTAIRLLPMTVVIVPYFRGDPGPGFLKLLAVHFIAITAWVESQKHLPALPVHLRLPFFIGLGLGFLAMTLGGTILGFLLAGTVPPVVAAALLFTTPVYFLLSLIGAIRARADAAAIAIGAAVGPPAHLVTPEFDLLVAGLVGGTLAWALACWDRRAPRDRRQGGLA